jgi:hypothetical protein
LSEYLQMLERAAEKGGGGGGETNLPPTELPPLPQIPAPGTVGGISPIDVDQIFKNAEAAVDELWATLGPAIAKPWEGMFGEGGTLTTQLRTFSKNVRDILGGLFGSKVSAGVAGKGGLMIEIPGIFDRLGESIAKIDIDGLVRGVREFAQGFGRGFDWPKIANAFNSIRWNDIGEALGNANWGDMGEALGLLATDTATATLDALGRLMSEVDWDAAVEAIISFANAMGDMQKSGSLGDFVTAMTDLINLVLELAGAIDQVTSSSALQGWQKAGPVGALLGWLLGDVNWEGIGSWVQEKIADPIIDVFQRLADTLVGHSIIPEMMDSIYDVITGTVEDIQKFWEEKWKAVGDFLDDPVGKAIDTFIGEPVEDLRETFADTITNTLNRFINEPLTRFKDFIAGPVTASVSTFVTEPAESLRAKIADGLTAAFNTFVAEPAESLRAKIADGLTAAFNTFVAEPAESLRAKIAEGLTTTFDTFVATPLENMRKGFTDKLGGALDALREGPLDELLAKIAGAATDKLGEFLGNVIDPLAAGVDSVASAVGRVLGPLGDLIAKIAGFRPPAWFLAWIGHSPAPLATGIDSVAKAIRYLERVGIEALAGQVRGPQVPGAMVNPAKYEKIINIEINPTYKNVESEANLYYDVVAALGAAAL